MIYALSSDECEEIHDILLPLFDFLGISEVETFRVTVSRGLAGVAEAYGYVDKKRRDLEFPMSTPTGVQSDVKRIDLFRPDEWGSVPSIASVISAIIANSTVRQTVLRRCAWLYVDEMRLAVERAASLNTYVSGEDIAKGFIEEITRSVQDDGMGN